MATRHHLQHGPIESVPTEKAPRMRIDPKNVDHFHGFFTSPHMVQDLPFGKKNLQLSSGKVLTVQNVIRTMIQERIVGQYTNYCKELGFTPFSRRTILRVLTIAVRLCANLFKGWIMLRPMEPMPFITWLLLSTMWLY